MDEVREGSPPAHPSLPDQQLTQPDPPSIAPSQEPTNTILFNSQGLRAGWRLLLYIIMWRALRMLLGIALEKIDPTCGSNSGSTSSPS
jgi:hypothetical protein